MESSDSQSQSGIKIKWNKRFTDYFVLCHGKERKTSDIVKFSREWTFLGNTISKSYFIIVKNEINQTLFAYCVYHCLEKYCELPKIIFMRSCSGIGWASWKRRWFILTCTSLVFFRRNPVLYSLCIYFLYSMDSGYPLQFVVEPFHKTTYTIENCLLVS